MDAKPGPDDIDIAWRDAAELALLLRAPPPIGKRERKAMQALQRSLQAQVARIDAIADTLAYFLEAALSHRRHPSTWQRDMLDLAVDTTPYTDPQHLADSCTAFLHLVTILPAHLLPHLTAGMCRSLVGADNHNAFGIRAGGEDGEEYMGYGVYPAASYFNHSCAPNITKQRIGPSWIFTAARDIGPGEECCITYLGGDEKDLDVVARRARLEQVWAFGCSCARCCQDEASRRPCSAALDS
jgi:SET and MYND domain-containing protein